MTDLVHPDNIEMAVRAVKAIGLDVGGVDFLTTDVTESYKEIGGAICEVNAAPGFRMHMAPSEGRPRDVGGPVMDMLFPPGTPSRIPIAAITGTNGKTTTARMLAHIQKLAGHHVGLTSTDGVYIDGQRTVPGDMTGPVATRMVLSDPSVDVAVLEIARGGLLRAGMGVRHCDVGAVLNVKADHLGLRGIGTLEQLAEVKRIVVEVARDTAILNADDPLCLKMADYTEAKHLCYVTMDPTHELVGEHIQAGGRGVVLESGIKGQMITIYDHGAHIPLLWTHLIPATLEGRAMHNVQNAMFAAAMAFSMGLKLEDIRHGLRTFDTTFFQAPGRMNIYDEHPFKVILDYGHNPAAIEAMCELVDRLEVAGRRIVRAGGAGRPAGRGHRRDRADRGRALRPLHLPARRSAPRPAARTRCPICCEKALLEQRRSRRPDPGDPGGAAGGGCRAPGGRAQAISLLIFARRHHPELEAGDSVPARCRPAVPGAAPQLAAGAGSRPGHAADGGPAAGVRAGLARRPDRASRERGLRLRRRRRWPAGG